MSGHTQGPWTHALDGHGAYSIESDDCDGVQVCFVRNESNARLIAAAPELLGVAKLAVDKIEEDGEPLPGTRWHALHVAATAAIEAATGGDS